MSSCILTLKCPIAPLSFSFTISLSRLIVSLLTSFLGVSSGISSSSESDEFPIGDLLLPSNFADFMSLVIQFSFGVIWFLPFLVLENSLPTFCKENVFRSISFVLVLEGIPPAKKKKKLFLSTPSTVNVLRQPCF